MDFATTNDMGVALGIEPAKVKVGWDHCPDHHLASKKLLNSLYLFASYGPRVVFVHCVFMASMFYFREFKTNEKGSSLQQP